ncbi:unnamed protein product [Parnassius mnemosyne]|uniref:Uncharacterized protein n=1 Tax=Parnassius mnemosyne TaxID=213953 RepID=A0AAV1KYE5_9NEOP
MCDNNFSSKLADIPFAKPGFDSLTMSAPLLVQMNPEGRWENKKPESLDEERLQAVVQYLVASKALSAAESYCCQCAAESVKEGENPKYVPVIMMPICPADQCPFDMECELQKIKETETKPTKLARKALQSKETEKDHDKKKTKKRGFVLQRLTDFDLLSQW